MATPLDTAPSPAAKPRMSLRNRILFWMIAWLIVLMPFLFWRSTWFGRPLNDDEITRYLGDDSQPRHIQHALVQIGDRISRARSQGGNSAVPGADAQWSGAMLRLSTHPVEEIRNTDAW